MYIEFKEGQKFAQRGADTSPMHETFQDCGYVLLDTDIVVDIDNLSKETIKALIETFNIETQTVWTERGCHLYFTKPKRMKVKKDSFNALGVELEYKDNKNTPNGITIKRSGKLRNIDNVGVRQELPDVLKPMNNVESLLGLSDGDKTNSRLYSHKFKIQHMSDYMKIMRFINKHIIDYPFSDEDIERIARYEQDKMGNNSADATEEYSTAMMIKKDLKVVKYKKHLYSYDGQRYVSDNDDFVHNVSVQLGGKSTRFIDEVIKQLKYHSTPIKERKGGFDVKFKNGILRDGVFHNIESDEFTPYFIDLEYKEGCEPVEVIDYFLNNISKGKDGQEPEQAYRDFILEIVAHCLITDINYKQKRPFQKVFFFAGDGGNGKGALFKLIRTLLGEGNYKTNKLEKFSDERYIYGMKGKLANLGDDIEDSAIDKKIMSNLKSMSAYEEIELRKLHGMPVSESISATQVFTTNHILKSFEKGNAWERRVVWLPMYATPEREFEDFYRELLDEKALEYFLKLVIDALNRLKQNGDFTVSQRVKDFTDEYHKENNPVLDYLEPMDADDFIGKRPPEVFEGYEIWFDENIGQGNASSKQLREMIMSKFNLKISPRHIGGKSAKVYVVVK